MKSTILKKDNSEKETSETWQISKGNLWNWHSWKGKTKTEKSERNNLKNGKSEKERIEKWQRKHLKQDKYEKELTEKWQFWKGKTIRGNYEKQILKKNTSEKDSSDNGRNWKGRTENWQL